MKRLPRNVKKRAPGPHFKLYEKKVPSHHIQMDVKFLKLKNSEGQRIRRFQYKAIDDATRISDLKIYDTHTQQNAIDFMNTLILKLPFRIKMVRTDNGHEFQAKFHWHLMDLGISHAYIRKGTPRLNGKVNALYELMIRSFTSCCHSKMMWILKRS